MLGWLGAIHRDAWRDAARLGLQAGVAGAAAYAAARWLGFVDPFLVIMMAVTSLQRSVGGTMGEAMARPQAAVVGSLLGLGCLVLLPAGWGTAAALAVALFVVVGASALRPAWALGVVPAVGLALGGEGPPVEAAALRAAVPAGAAGDGDAALGCPGGDGGGGAAGEGGRARLGLERGGVARAGGAGGGAVRGPGGDAAAMRGR